MAFIFTLFYAVASMSALIQEGMQAPDFSLPVSAEKVISLADFKGKNVVIYFYPKDNTPGCTIEARSFTDHAGEFARLNTEILGISRDTIKSHAKFADNHALSFQLASDAESDVCERYGVLKEKSFMGKKYKGIVRTTILIDKNGIVQKVWPDVSVIGHVEDVLSAVRALEN